MNDSNLKLTVVSAVISIPQSSGDLEEVRHMAYDLMKTIEDYPSYMPSVNSIDILMRKDGEMLTRWDTQIDGAPICWIQRIQTNDSDLEIVFDAIEGDFDVFQGRWSVAQSDGRILLNLLVEYRLGIPIIEEVLGPILKEKIKANCEMMLQAIADRLTVKHG